MTVDNSASDYDPVELRGGRLHKIRRSEARMLGDEDRMVPVAKCYCRSHDVVTAAEAELQRRPTFFSSECSLIRATMSVAARTWATSSSGIPTP